MSGNYYYVDDDKQIIKEALLDVKASDIANQFKEQDYRSKRPAMTQTQLRRFFNDVNMLRKKYETIWREEERNGKPIQTAKANIFPRIAPHVKMLKSKVAYAHDKVPASFENFMNNSINNIKDYQDFEAFLTHFEAVVGFAKPVLKK